MEMLATYSCKLSLCCDFIKNFTYIFFQFKYIVRGGEWGTFPTSVSISFVLFFVMRIEDILDRIGSGGETWVCRENDCHIEK